MIGIILGGFFVGIILKKNNIDEKSNVNKKLIKLEYKSELPVSEYKCLGKKKALSNYNLYLYTDPRCETCFEKYEIIERMDAIFSKVGVTSNILWRNEPNSQQLNMLKLSKDRQFVNEDTEYTNGYPVYLLTDKEQSVLMISDDETKIIKKLYSLKGINRNDVIQSANDYLDGKISKKDKEKQDVIYFAMEGCPDCKRAMKEFKKHKILEKYNILPIYTSDSYGKKEWVDYGNIFQAVYNIEWWPSFLIIDKKNYKFIGEEPDSVLIDLMNKGL